LLLLSLEGGEGGKGREGNSERYDGFGEEEDYVGLGG
jgi:hypothetical protein